MTSNEPVLKKENKKQGVANIDFIDKYFVQILCNKKL